MSAVRGALCVLACALAAPAALRAAPAEPMLYTVKAGDTCTSIARAVYGSAKEFTLIHRSNPLGPTPHHLAPGTVLRLPPLAAPGRPDAQLTFLRNSVEAFTPEQHAGHKDEPLSRGHKVGTLGDSSAEVTFADETLLQLGEHSLVVILGGERAAARRSTEADTTLLKGTLRAHLAELVGQPARPVSLGTPGARVRLGRGEAQLQVDEQRSTRLAVYRGTSRLRAAGKDVKVPSGFGSRADLGRAPTPPRPLPASPVWASPPTPLVLTLADRADAAAGYREGAGAGPPAAGFRVQLARDERFSDLVLDARVPVATVTLEARGLLPGAYLGRVAAIDADQFEGPPGPVWRLRVEALAVREAEGRPTLITPAGLLCGVDGEAPRADGGARALAPGRPHEVRCALAAGGDLGAAAQLALPAMGPPPVAPSAPPSLVPAPPPAIVRPRPSVSVHLEGAILAGAIIEPSSGRAGPAAGFEVGLRTDLPRGSLAVALRPRYEFFLAGGDLRVPCPAATCPLADAVGPYSLLLDRHVLAIGLPLSYRLPELARRLRPYVGLAPELMIDFATTRDGPLRRTALGLGGHLGLQVRLGPGGAFAEAGYRHVFLSPAAPDDAPLRGLSLHAGYRFGF